MNTNTYPTTGSLNFGAYHITFGADVVDNGENWVTLYDANRDDESTRLYATIKDVLETVTLLATSRTAREEYFNA